MPNSRTPPFSPHFVARRRVMRHAVGGLLGTVVAGSALRANAALPIPDEDGWYEISNDPVAGGSEPAIGSANSRTDADAPKPALDESAWLPAERRIQLFNDHTGEHLEIDFATGGRYVAEALESIDHLMRDHREDEKCVMDPRLIDDLFRLQSNLDTSEPLHILSGYRTPQTNAKLRKRSSGVARYSLHIKGKAADIYVPGVKTRTLQQAALALDSGGVGYYGNSGFVHVDTGLKRRWGS